MDDFTIENDSIRSRLAVAKASAASATIITNLAKDMVEHADKAIASVAKDDSKEVEIKDLSREALEGLVGMFLSSMVGFRNSLVKVEADCNANMFRLTEQFYPQLTHFDYRMTVDYGDSINSEIKISISDITPSVNGDVKEKRTMM